MYPTLIRFGPLPVHSYGLMVALGFIAGIFLTIYFARKEQILAETILDLAIYVIITSIVGARLFYILGQWGFYLEHPAEIIMLQNGGLVFLGGLIFSLLAVIVYARLKKIKLLKLLDAIAPGVALGYAIGRLGCFLNGCCFGLPTKLPWGMVFPQGSLAALYCPGERLHPTQLYSALAGVAIFVILFLLYRKKKFSGEIFFWGLVLYSLYRFLVEFLRFSPDHWLGLTPSQWLVIIAFYLGTWGLNYFRRAKD